VLTESRRERGSVLMLMPAAILVMLVLGSIVVDFALVGVRQRALPTAAAAAANDAATAALSADALRAGDTAVDPDRAEQIVLGSIAAHGLHLSGPPIVTVGDDGRTVTVRLAAAYDYVFAGALPGAPDGFTVQAVASAAAVTAPDG
jgi:hypothetical protein